MPEIVIPKRWKDILYFHQHPEQHPDSDYACDSGEESEVVLWAHSLEAELVTAKAEAGWARIDAEHLPKVGQTVRTIDGEIDTVLVDWEDIYHPGWFINPPQESQ